MLVDARSLARGERIECDICVVGSGPAGLTLAHALERSSAKVCVVESGGIGVEPDAQSLNEGEVEGDAYTRLDESRRRQLGGTANTWQQGLRGIPHGVRFVPLDPLDFEQRQWLPHSGWPFRRTELDPYYERAHAVLGLGDFDYGADTHVSAQAPLLELGTDIRTGMFRFGPRTVFTQTMAGALARSTRHVVLLHATVGEIQLGESSGRVRALDALSSDGKPFTIEARFFVLAAGGIENARLLLLSRRSRPQGIGNEHDLVGRFFMDHPLLRGGMIVPRDRNLIPRMALYDQRDDDRTSAMGYLELAPEVRRREHLLHMTWLLFPRPSSRSAAAVRAFRELRESRTADPRRLIPRAARVVAGSDFLVPALYRRLRTGRPLLSHVDWGGWSMERGMERRYTTIDVIHQTEQAPDPENRVLLGDSRDRFGLLRANLRWRWNRVDVDSALRSQNLFSQAIAAAGVGEVTPERRDGKPVLELPGTHHHLGTTRMHPDPKLGVVDQHGLVHGTNNLYIAGGSVFPTGGFANPTLTIVALALRLADHLKRQASPSQLENASGS